METLAIVAARHPRFVRNNPLVENRIWLNCFDGKDLPLVKILLEFLMTFGLGDGNEGVRNASRNAVRDIVAAHGSSDEAIAFFLHGSSRY